MRKTTLLCDLCGNEIKEEKFANENYYVLVDKINVCVDVIIDGHDICQPCAMTLLEKICKGELIKSIKAVASKLYFHTKDYVLIER